MRRTRARRRFKFILVSLLVVCSALFIESRIEAFVPQIKTFADVKIGETFGGKFNISVGSLDGGIVKPFVLNDIKIKDKKGVALFSSIDIDSIKTNYRLWDVFFKNRSFLSNLLSRDSFVYVNFVTKNRQIFGFAKLEGDLLNPTFKGCVNMPSKDRIDFTGEIKQDSFDIKIMPSAGVITAHGVVSENEGLMMDVKVNNVKIGKFDITCDAKVKNKVVASSANPDVSSLEGEIETSNMLLGYKPFLNLKASYVISDGVLKIKSLNLGDSFSSSGSVALKDPYKMDLVVTANNVSLSWLMLSLGVSEAKEALTGTMNSKFIFKGTFRNPRMEANLDIRKGTISTLDFDTLTATLKGDLPFVKIEDSRISRESGYFVLAGEINLARLGKGNMFDDIKIASDDRAVMWDGWNTSKTQDSESINMKKRLNDNINLDFKKFVADQTVDESIRDKDEVQLEYKLNGKDSLKMMMGQDKDFFGLEHKDKF